MFKILTLIGLFYIGYRLVAGPKSQSIPPSSHKESNSTIDVDYEEIE